MKLHVEIKGQGEPMLCLHGHPGSSKTMSVFTNVLSQHFRTIAPDLRGYGKSPAGGKFQMQDHLADLEELLDKYEIEDCILLGWSLGGILSLELALRQPQRFKALIIVASAAYPLSDHPATSLVELINTGVAGVVSYFQPKWRWSIDLGKKSLFRYLVASHNPDVYRYLGEQGVPAFLQTSLAANRALATELSKGYNRLADISSIDIPSLVLAGECDRHITADSSEKTAQRLPNCNYICYPNTAHLFPWEIPDLVNQDILTWLENRELVGSKCS